MGAENVQQTIKIVYGFYNHISTDKRSERILHSLDGKGIIGRFDDLSSNLRAGGTYFGCNKIFNFFVQSVIHFMSIASYGKCKLEK